MVRRTRSIAETIKEGRQFLIATGSKRRNIKKKYLRKTRDTKMVTNPISRKLVISKKNKDRESRILESKKEKEETKPVNRTRECRTVDKKDSKPIPIKKAIEKKEKKSEKIENKKSSFQEQPKQGPRVAKSTLSEEKGKVIHGMVDCVFVVDITGSMQSYLEKTRDCIRHLVKRVKNQTKTKDVSLRFGFVGYRDHPPQDNSFVTTVQELCVENEILQYIGRLTCTGGGDGAEAVFDGLNDGATKISWRDSSKIPSLRYIFHIADAPPHGKKYHKKNYDDSWQNGCPCGLEIEQIIHRINVREIHYRLIKVNNELDIMGKLLQKQIVNYEEETLEEGLADKMDIKITDMVIRELCPDVLYE